MWVPHLSAAMEILANSSAKLHCAMRFFPPIKQISMRFLAKQKWADLLKSRPKITTAYLLDHFSERYSGISGLKT